MTGVRIGRPEEMADARTRSYLADGRCVGWFTPFAGSVAVDAELADRPVPSALGKLFGVEGFWRRWTRAECAAKLSDTPIVLWLHEFGLDVPDHFPAEFVTCRTGDLAQRTIVTVAWRAPCGEA